MLKLMIFDFDGTLVDTLTDVGLTFNQALMQCGYPAHPIQDYERFVGGDLEQVVKRLLPENTRTQPEIDRVKTLYRELYSRSDRPNTQPYPGIPSLLRVLSQMGVGLAINTNKAQGLIQPMAKEHFAEIPFLAVIGSGADFPSKPAPDAAFALMRQANATSAETVYIGDGESDIQTAVAAGIPLLFVTWGQGSVIDLQDPRLALVAHSAEDLLVYAQERMKA